MGAKKRVPLHQNPRGFVEVDPTATEGAILGVNLRDSAGNIIRPQDVLNQPSSGGGTNSISSTIWRLIREIPANIQKLAALVGKGIAVRRDDGEWALRTLQEGTGIDIANPDGEAGNPTISLEDVADSGAGVLLATTFDAKGRRIGSKPATITGTTNQINVVNGDAAAGLPTLTLAAPVIASLAKADTALQPGAAHNTSLSGLQGGAAGEYYHATAAQNAALAALATSAYIDGFRMVWNSGTSITFESGVAVIQSTGSLLRSPTAITKSSLSLPVSAFSHCYAYSNAGTPDIEISSTVPAAAFFGTARSKTGDPSRRYIGSLLADATGQVLNFKHLPDSGTILYRNRQDLAPFRALAAGSATVETLVSLSGSLPVTAGGAQLRLFNNNTSVATFYSTSDDSAAGPPSSGIAAVPGSGNAYIPFPVDSAQAITYWNQTAPTAGQGAFVDVYGYYFGR